MAQAEEAPRRSGTINVLFRRDDSPALAKRQDLDWEDYFAVYPPFPSAEFHPDELLAGLVSDPPIWGPLPRPVRELDVIQMCIRGYPPMALLVVKNVENCVPHLRLKNSIITYCPDAGGFGLLMMGDMPDFYQAQRDGFGD